jgi:hypothetical protein
LLIAPSWRRYALDSSRGVKPRKLANCRPWESPDVAHERDQCRRRQQPGTVLQQSNVALPGQRGELALDRPHVSIVRFRRTRSRDRRNMGTSAESASSVRTRGTTAPPPGS